MAAAIVELAVGALSPRSCATFPSRNSSFAQAAAVYKDLLALWPDADSDAP
jgi:hypothetical protein